MVSRKQIADDARRLFRLSLVDGRVSEQRVSAILAALAANPPSGYLGLLRAYHRLIRREVDRGLARIHHAGPLSPDLPASIAAAFARRYNRSLTPVTAPKADLIAGLEVRVGDDVYDFSVAGALARLAQA